MKNTEELHTIIAIAGSVRNDGTMYTEESIRKAAKMHEDLLVKKTSQGIALVWKGKVPYKSDD